MANLNVLNEENAVASALEMLEGTFITRGDKPYTWKFALQRLKTFRAAHGDEMEEYEDTVVGEVYGAGGVTRYYIRGNGTIQFSKHHCHDSRKLNQAMELGFEIF